MTEASVSFAGNLTDDPEVRSTDGGIARAMFRVAVSGRREQKPSFFTVVVWRNQAEHVAESLAKGSRVVVVGRLQQRTWTITAILHPPTPVINVTSRRCQRSPTDRFTAPGPSATMAHRAIHDHPARRQDRRQEVTPMDLGNPVILIVALVAGLTVLMLGLSWLFNGSWPWQRPPHGSDEIDRDRYGEPGLLGRFFPGGGGRDGGAGGS